MGLTKSVVEAFSPQRSKCFLNVRGWGGGVCRYSVQFNGFTLPVSKPCVLFSSHSPDEDSSQKFIPFIGVCVHLQRCFIV